MKRIAVARAIAGLFFLAAGPGQAFANCSAVGTLITGTTLTNLLTNSMVCLPTTGVPASGSAWEDQELHQSGGGIQEYAQGGSTSSPSNGSYGSWSISSNTVSYRYPSNGSTTAGPYLIYGSSTGASGQYEYCTSSTNLYAKVYIAKGTGLKSCASVVP